MNRRTALALTAAGTTVATALMAAPAAADGSATSLVRVSAPLTSYDSTLVPAGARAKVISVSRDGKTMVTLKVKGLLANREYGAHAHNLPCGSTGAAAGAHYQYVQDPATVGDPTTGSTDPVYANPDNEIWLDLTTNAAGTGRARSSVAWTFPAQRRPQSVVLHLEHTHTGPTDSGVAGRRLACISVPF